MGRRSDHVEGRTRAGTGRSLVRALKLPPNCGARVSSFASGIPLAVPVCDASVVYSTLVNRFSATRFGSWLVKHLAARVDPLLFRWSKGRLTATGVPTLPMLTLTTIGRRSGRPRATQLAFHRDGDDLLVVASAMGQAHAPDWMHNLIAQPDVEVQLRGESYPVRAELLSDDERAGLWPAIQRTIPQMSVYERRTQRPLKVFRLRRR